MYLFLYKCHGEWTLQHRSSLQDAMMRANQYKLAGENDPGTYTETKVFQFDPETLNSELLHHVNIKQKPVVQYNKRGAAKKEGSIKVEAAPWNSATYSTLIQQASLNANPFVVEGS